MCITVVFDLACNMQLSAIEASDSTIYTQWRQVISSWRDSINLISDNSIADNCVIL